MTKTFQCDVAIVGGGLAGSLAALTLSSRGFSCALIDAADPAVMREAAFDGRTTALSYACARVFKRLGLWEAIEPKAEAIRDILVTDGRAAGALDKGKVSSFYLHFNSRELGEDQPLGWIIENRTLRDAMFDAIEKRGDITLIAPARRATTEYDNAFGRIALEDGREVAASLIVAADGRHSALRAEAGIKTNHWRYAQAASSPPSPMSAPIRAWRRSFSCPRGRSPFCR